MGEPSNARVDTGCFESFQGILRESDCRHRGVACQHHQRWACGTLLCRRNSEAASYLLRPPRQGDAGVREILFLGTPTTTISAKAVIEGQADPERLEFSPSLLSPAEQYAEIQRQNRISGYFLGGVGTFTLFAALILFFSRRSEKL